MNRDPVENNEQIARFIVFKRWVGVDGRVKQDVFIPPSNLQLSVTRHIGMTDSEIWDIGRSVANIRQRSLYGRADVEVSHIRDQSLDVQPFPFVGNRNHADIVNWPNEKHERKMLAIEIAANANFVSCP